MSDIGDSSQLSDISGISRISHLSSIRPSTKPDSVFMSECQASSTIREPPNRCKIESSSVPDASKIMKSIITCENAMTNHARLKLMYDCLHELAQSKDSPLQSVTSEKLKGVLAVHEVGKYLKLPNTEENYHEDLTLLGITDLPKIHLTNDEKCEIRAACEKIYLEKMNNFLDSYKKLGGNIEELLKTQESAGKAILSESDETDCMPLKETTDELCSEYHRDLLRSAEILSQWQRLKNIEMREVNAKIAENLLLHAQFSEIQASIGRKTCASRMFNETPTTADAFKILSDRLDSVILDTREKIEKKTFLLKKYADVSSPEYDNLVKKYKELRSVIKKKEDLLKMLD